MIRSVVILAAVLSLFLFPWPFALVLATSASLMLPVSGVALGIVYDALYMPGGSWPLATTAGLLLTGAALLVRRFIKARIMTA